MIMTITLNPAIDKTIELSEYTIGELNKVDKWIQDPGGKGINVSKVIESLGGKSIATGFLGGTAGLYIENALKDLGIANDFVQIADMTRTNLKIFDKQTKETTEINEPGPFVSEADIKSLIDKIEGLIKLPCVVVISGSAPKSVPDDIYETLVSVAKSKGAKVFLDASGLAFKAGLKGKPDFIKPNKHELEIYFGKNIETEEDLKIAGHHFVDLGVEHVFISLGKKGAFYANKEKSLRLRPLRVDAYSSVGAGDAFVGAFVYAYDHEYEVEEMLRLAIATSAGAVMTIGTKPMNVEWIMSQIDRVVIDYI